MTPDDAGDQIEVGPLASSELADVARVHIGAFHSSFMSKLGAHLVRQMYAWHLGSGTDAAIVVARRHGKVVGFVLFGRSFASIDRFVLRHGVAITAKVVRHPARFAGGETAGRWRQGVGILRSRISGSDSTERPRPQGSIGILSIGVDPAVEGSGVGKALMRAVEQIARDRGAPELRLSVRTENERARGFYRSLGWKEVGERPTGGIDMRLDLHAQPV